MRFACGGSMLDPISDLMGNAALFEDAVFAQTEWWWVLLSVPVAIGAMMYGARARAYSS